MQCAPGEPSYLVSIEEVSTCKYLVQFSSNLLCKHPAFAADKKKEVQPQPSPSCVCMCIRTCDPVHANMHPACNPTHPQPAAPRTQPSSPTHRPVPQSIEPIQCEPLDANGAPLPPPLRTAGAPSPPAAGEAGEAGATVEQQGGAAAAGAAGAAAGAAAGGASPSGGGAAAERKAAARPAEVAFDLGQCLLHRRYSYRGVIVGFDQTCQQSEAHTRPQHPQPQP